MKQKEVKNVRIDKGFEEEQYKKIQFLNQNDESEKPKRVSHETKTFVDCSKQFRKREKRLQEKQNYYENLRNKSVGKPYDCCSISATWMHLTSHIEVKECLECGKILEIRSY